MESVLSTGASGTSEENEEERVEGMEESGTCEVNDDERDEDPEAGWTDVDDDADNPDEGVEGVWPDFRRTVL